MQSACIDAFENIIFEINRSTRIDNITYYVQSTSIPNVKIGNVNVPFFAAGFEVPGVITYPDSWSVKIILDQDLTQYKRLRSWQEAMSNYQYSGGGYKTIPNVVACVNLLDNTMQNVVKEYMMEGIWIQKLGDVSFEYKEGENGVATCDCTFTLQYWYEAETEQDPLNARSIR